jgi:hypothetical protein
MASRLKLYAEIDAERRRQEEKWGIQNHPMNANTHHWIYTALAKDAKKSCETAAKEGTLTWFDILFEEFCEVFAERDLCRQREELIQVAAVAVQMIEYIDRRLG